MNLGSGFLFIWLPSMTLFAILLTLVAKGSNYARVALNIVLPVALLFLGFNLLQTVDSMLPQTLLRFLFMVSLFWLPLFIVLICVNHQSAAVWFDPALSSLNSRPKLGLNLKEVILGLLFAAVWAFMLGVLMMSAIAIFWPFLIIIGNFIKTLPVRRSMRIYCSTLWRRDALPSSSRAFLADSTSLQRMR